ncbi:hypothetical protein ACVPPR_01110 [Dellaglioa sp. L3N]
MDEMNSLKNGSKNVFGFTQVTPGYSWIGSKIDISDDNKFSVNGVEYDGNDIYVNGKDFY